MIIVTSLFKSLTILCLLTFVISCASLEKLKFWGDEEEIELPASLTEFEQSISIVELWSIKLGKYEVLGRITPSFSSNSIFYITSEGKIFVIDTETGKELWTKDTGDIVSGGIESKFKTLIYGTLDGEVVVLDQVRGKEIWRAHSSGEILSSPLTDGSIVAAQSSDLL
jgi:outer membrane protein assembly factor BamB